jgi:hypothetical protein
VAGGYQGGAGDLQDAPTPVLSMPGTQPASGGWPHNAATPAATVMYRVPSGQRFRPRTS